MNLTRRRRWSDEIREELTELRYDIKYCRSLSSGGKSTRLLNLMVYRKRLAYLLRRVTQCPECRGSGMIPDVDYDYDGEPFVLTAGFDCPTCNGSGRL